MREASMAPLTSNVADGAASFRALRTKIPYYTYDDEPAGANRDTLATKYLLITHGIRNHGLNYGLANAQNANLSFIIFAYAK